MAQIEEGAKHEKGEKGPALAIDVKVAQAQAPQERHGQKHEGRLEDRDAGLERRPHEVGRDEG